jgi:arylsulfatase
MKSPLSLLGALLIAAPSISAAKPNIVVILADDMGWSDLGCYGSEIETPHLDALAQGGLRFTQFYNTTRCCPTRAALLTGLHQHQAGMGHMTANDGIPSYQGYLNDRCVTLAEAIKPAGYTTLAIGKWHVGAAAGQWPLDRGFDRYWGSPSGGGVYFKETLQMRKGVFFVRGAQEEDLPAGKYITDVFTDRAMEFVEEAVTKTKHPFFLYLAHIAPHWPLQAKPEDIAKYAGRYAQGWDEAREQRFARQKAAGLLPGSAVLSARDPAARAWTETPADRREDLIHRMAVYAAQVDCLDQNVGRLVAKLRELDQLHNTLILFLSDNGCSAEGGPGGFSRGQPGAPIGTALSYASVGLEWANVSDTPFRRFKISTHEGGISTPLIAHWPAGIPARGELRHQPGHVIDLMPTLLDVAGASYPADHAGKAILPPEGQSLVPAFQNQEVNREALYWEHEGNKAVRQGRWKAVAPSRAPWELYDLEADRTESRNVAGKHPEILQELTTLWQSWAERCGVWEWPALQKHRQERGRRPPKKTGADKK